MEGSDVSLQQWTDQLGRFKLASRHESERKQPLGKESPNDPLAGDREACAALFTNRKGNVAKPLRLAWGPASFRRSMAILDEETALQIQETPYLQYFCGYPGYDDEKLPLIMGKAMKQQYEIFMVMCLLDNVSTRLL